ncbi:MAG: hypothetical protein M1813_008119 [Trichoglossum hirsutum]|nr:MAG: hypothetical protein M1813_008119 [Trichoglossum hirsutum]
MLRINVLTAFLLLFLAPFMAVLAEETTTTTRTSTCTITKTVSKVVATAIVTGTPPPPMNSTISYSTYANSTTSIVVAAPTQNATSPVKPNLAPTATTNAASGHHASTTATWFFGFMVALAGFVL